MHCPRELLFVSFGGHGDPLVALSGHTQVNYLRGYLADLGASSIIEEPNYFDRDYLSEFSAFYCVSAAGYPNLCRRLHFFSGPLVHRAEIEAAASNDLVAKDSLQERYLGFVVLRPIPQAPLGRTVLKWYEDQTVMTPRVVATREYCSNLAGVGLLVRGLAWQQQDTGVGACATVGLWTMFHSSAFDDHHAIPTTADITRSAHETASLGARVFPSDGLTPYQIAEAIKAWNLSPLIVEGNKQLPGGRGSCFDTLRFNASIAAFIRSGYPVLLIGELAGNGLHAICVVGFRSSGNPTIGSDSTEIQDSWITNIYAHDDNIGPNVRLKVWQGAEGQAILSMDAPTASAERQALNLPLVGYVDFVPSRMVVGVHVDLRTSAETLYRAALRVADGLRIAVNACLQQSGGQAAGNTVSARFVRLREYLSLELSKTLVSVPAVLSKVRLALVEQVPPMSLHVGLIRIGDANSAPIMDILYDTTDSDRNHPVFANIAYSPIARAALTVLAVHYPENFNLGVGIDGF